MIIPTLIALSCLLTIGIGGKVLYALYRYRFHAVPASEVSVENLPSVSLCIPARDETHAMTDCLERALSSDYPKLEIIVLDDGSRDDTSILIKSFAHAGVRFVEGKSLADGWLGKNYALHGLASEASGRLLVFADVDTRLHPQSISKLVAYAQQQGLDMLSVLPQRADRTQTSNILTTLRQFWTLAFISRQHPAVASNLWMIRRSLLSENDGFEPVKKSIRPEVSIARRVGATLRYGFVVSTRVLGVEYEKRLSSQRETSIRLAFPMLRRSWLLTFGAALLLLIALVPYAVVIAAAMGVADAALLVGVSSVAVAAQLVVYSIYLAQIRARGWSYGAIFFPVVLVQEFCLLLVSAVRYSRRTITWKGRPVENHVRA